MPVAATVRLAPPGTDPAAAIPTEGAVLVEIFGEIISGLTETGVEAAIEIPGVAAAKLVGEETPLPPLESDVDAAVAQLLALASARPAEVESVDAPKDIALALEHSADAEVETGDLVTTQVIASVAPIAAPSSASTPVAPSTIAPPTAAAPATVAPMAIAQAPSAQPTNPVHTTQPAPVRSEPIATPQAAAFEAPVVDPKPETGDLKAAAPAAAATPQIASERTQTVVQMALSSLEAAVKGAPAQAWTATPLPAQPVTRARRGGETEPTVTMPELKLTTAMALPAINAALAAFEPLRPADAVQIGTQPAPQPVDASELMIEHQLDMAHEGEWLDQLARDIAKSAGNDSGPLRFRLNPETLGSLRVEITQDRGGTAVRLTADTETARAIIADAQPRLIAEARAQGIRISEAHVDLGGQTASGDPRRQNGEFEEPQLRTARSLQEKDDGDGKPTPGRSERYA